jgi:sulfite reductase (ferredoxin)
MTPPTATLATPPDLVAFDASDRVGLEPFPDDIDLSALTPADLPPGAYGDLDEIAEFEELVRKVRAGEISDDDFRPLRLHFGVYGIRQSTETHMVRVKTPLGRFNARQFDAMALIAERYAPPRVGHITTRQCFQFHRIPLEQVADVLKVVAVAGLTTREACGNAIRNVTMSPLAGVHPSEELDVQAAADEIVRALLRHPAYQSLPRKFKIAFSATPDDDAGTGFHDVGVIPKHSPDGEPGYQIVLGGGLGSSAREAVALEPWTRPEHLLPTALAALDIFEEKGERRNRVRARMKFLVKKMGAEAFVAEVLERREAHIANGVLSTVVPHPSVPEAEAVPIPTELPAELADRDLDAYRAWLDTNVVRQRQGDRFALWASLYLGDLDPDQFRAIARMMRETGVGDARLTIRQNVVFRDVTAEQLPHVWAVLSEHGLDRPFAEKSGDVVSCPGAETCNLAITASRGLGAAIQDQLRDDNLDAVKGVGINISGCPNSCGQHQAWDIGFSGMAKHDAAGNEAPAYRVWVGGHNEDGGSSFADYVVNVPAKHAPLAASRLLDRYLAERTSADEPMHAWYERIGGKAAVAEILDDLRDIPSFAEDRSFYTDWGSRLPFEVILGQGECMVYAGRRARHDGRSRGNVFGSGVGRAWSGAPAQPWSTIGPAHVVLGASTARTTTDT